MNILSLLGHFLGVCPIVLFSHMQHSMCRQQQLVWLNCSINNSIMDARQAACRQ